MDDGDRQRIVAERKINWSGGFNTFEAGASEDPTERSQTIHTVFNITNAANDTIVASAQKNSTAKCVPQGITSGPKLDTMPGSKSVATIKPSVTQDASDSISSGELPNLKPANLYIPGKAYDPVLAASAAESFQNGKCIVTWKYRAENGGKTATGRFRIVITRNSQVVKEHINQVLAGRGGRNYQSGIALVPGTNAVEIYLDADNQVAEVEENDNKHRTNYNVVGTCNRLTTPLQQKRPGGLEVKKKSTLPISPGKQNKLKQSTPGQEILKLKNKSNKQETLKQPGLGK